MSTDGNQDDKGTATAPATSAGGEDNSAVLLPVEVEAPDEGGAAGDAKVAELEAKLVAAEKEKKDNWDRYLRAAADLENLRKRQKREADDAKFDAKSKVLKEMLPVVDNLERAIEHASSPGDDSKPHPIVEGVQLVLRQFTTAFERLDVTAVEALDQPFDPNLHEAISQAESDKPAGTVVQVLQRGYKAGDRLLRPTLVVVAKAKATPPSEG
ncbi:MAG TPA: nucleotide exchange factor GrpE [Kofleriaceae bacterium]|jgi:molecular chaperone GrpE